jgi:hypothetical protein
MLRTLLSKTPCRHFLVSRLYDQKTPSFLMRWPFPKLEWRFMDPVRFLMAQRPRPVLLSCASHSTRMKVSTSVMRHPNICDFKSTEDLIIEHSTACARDALVYRHLNAARPSRPRLSRGAGEIWVSGCYYSKHSSVPAQIGCWDICQ